MKFEVKNIKWIIIGMIAIILSGGIGVYAGTEYFANDIKYTKKDGNEISVASALNELYSRKTYISFDNAFLQSGSFIGNTSITENNKNSSFGLSITGNSAATWDQNEKPDNRWEKEIDFTNFSMLTFYAKKGADHGTVCIYIDDTIVKDIYYTDLKESWTECFVDLSKYQGIHKLIIGGGYGDRSGSTSSNTQYCDIRLY